jgi:ankyrin repeat protein
MKAIQKFAESKANIDKKNDYGLTPIHVAVLTKNDPAYILLVEKGADLAMPVEGKFASRYKGKDIMRLAIESSNLFVMEHLLKNKYHPEKVVSKNLDTPLHVAAVKCNAAMIDKLISYGANVNAVASNGYTALHIAAKTRCFSAVTALIEAGADPKIKDQKGKLAMDIIEKDRAQELSYYLEKKTRAPASVRR